MKILYFSNAMETYDYIWGNTPEQKFYYHECVKVRPISKMCGITEALLIPNLERGTYLIIPDVGEHQKVFNKFQDIFNKAWDVYSDKLWIKCKKENLAPEAYINSWFFDFTKKQLLWFQSTPFSELEEKENLILQVFEEVLY